MKPKLMLTIAGVYYVLDGLAGFFMVSGFDFITYAYSIFCMSLGVLFLIVRSESASKARDAIFITGFFSSFGVAVVGFYAQWSGKFIDSPAGYIPVSLWLIVAIGLFLIGRANMSTSAR